MLFLTTIPSAPAAEVRFASAFVAEWRRADAVDREVALASDALAVELDLATYLRTGYISPRLVPGLPATFRVDHDANFGLRFER